MTVQQYLYNLQLFNSSILETAAKFICTIYDEKIEYKFSFQPKKFGTVCKVTK